ncbi:MAG: DUF3084 domain-containing protein [Limnochordia bacterium]|jgi:uncharacterized protein (DUF3084 family)
MYGLSLIAILAVTGGLIAYLGDRMGMTIGRKKLTLFGLRPKHTSILITIFTGIFISVGTLAVLSIVSEDVRTALFHIREIQEALATSEVRYQESQSQLLQQQARADELAQEIAAMADELQLMVTQRDAAQADLLEAKAEEARVLAAYEKAQGELEFEQARVENLTEISEKIQQRVEELERTEAALNEKIAALWEAYQDLSETYQKQTERMRFGNVAYRSGEIILAAVFNGGKPLPEAEADLLDFLMLVNRAALERGARILGKPNYALQLVSQEHFDTTAKMLSQEEGKFVVRGVSSGNTMLGEPVVVHFEVIPEQQIFTAGEVIAADTVDGRVAAQIEDRILQLLRQVNEIAIERGMITDPHGLVGQTSGGDFLEAITAVKLANGPVRVLAVAAADTWSTEGPLQIRLQVEGN